MTASEGFTGELRIAKPHTGADTISECLWCGKALRSRRGGSAARFCCARHRLLYWAACREWCDRAIALGILTAEDLKADPAACTLAVGVEEPPPAPEIGPADSASAEPQAEFIVRVPRKLIQQLIFVHCQLRHSEADDLPSILAALGRIGRGPKTKNTVHGKLLTY
jgi:hypothetical protein